MKKLRNNLTVRINDEDYDAFLSVCGRHYSATLRAFVQLYVEKATPEDLDIPLPERIKTVISR